jgi:hypothetical protein
MDLIVIFKPLLLEMEAYQESLDKDEFIESSLALLQVSFFQFLTVFFLDTHTRLQTQNSKLRQT